MERKIVRMIGGLGNQMFQFAFGESLKGRPGVEVKYDTRFFKGYTLHNGLEINRVFGVEVEEATREELWGVTVPVGSYRVARVRERLGLLRSGEIEEPESKRVLTEEEIGGKRYFNGYWQNERYFGAIEGRIRELLRFPELEGEENVRLGRMLGDGEWCSVHVRRGDYLSHPLYKGICGEDYYRRGVERVRSEVRGVRFAVFSNDMDWVRENLGGVIGEDAVYVGWNRGGDSYRDMQLMTLCGHNIIANSSFSWWGAWLNGNRDKIVIAPERWMNGEFETDPVCESWKRI